MGLGNTGAVARGPKPNKRTSARITPTLRSRISKRLNGPANSVIVVLVVVVLGALLFYLTFALFSTGSNGSPPAARAGAGLATSDTAPERGIPASDEVQGPSGCMVDTDCDQGQSCRVASCVTDLVAGTECRIDHDCRVGQACRDGSCEQGPDSAL